jgi:hypothetical protein
MPVQLRPEAVQVQLEAVLRAPQPLVVVLLVRQQERVLDQMLALLQLWR